MPAAIGIDLGTSYLCSAVFKDGEVKVMPNIHGNLTTPSYLAFNHNEIIFGEGAKNRIASNASNTVFNIRSALGHKIKDPFISYWSRYWSFRFISDANENPLVQVDQNYAEKVFSVEEILGLMLKNVKENAERFLNDFVQDAVITIPASYNYFQRNAIKKAANFAGLNVRLLPSPNAAALAYDFNRRIKNEQNVLIFDLGGNSCNISIVTIEDSIYEVRALVGNNNFGGEVFVNFMITHFLAEFKRKFGKDIFSNIRAICRLRITCEDAMRTLSSENQANIELESLFDGIDFSTSITRAKFEEICAYEFGEFVKLVERALIFAKMNKENIDEIILVGGASRIPKIQELLSNFFNGKRLNKSLHPDEAAAFGAAIRAGMLSKVQSKQLQEMIFSDVAPSSIGIETANQEVHKIIKGLTTFPTQISSKFPTKSSRTFTTTFDNQSSMLIKVYEGERLFSKDNNFLGYILLNDIQPAPAGVPQIEIAVEITFDDNITVYVRDESTGKQISIDISKDGNDLSQNNDVKMSSKNQLQNLCRNISQMLTNLNISGHEYDTIAKKCVAAFATENPREIESLKEEIEAIWNPIISRYYPSPCPVRFGQRQQA